MACYIARFEVLTAVLMNISVSSFYAMYIGLVVGTSVSDELLPPSSK